MKVTVVGAGNVGATCAQRIAEGSIADVYLVDVVEGLAAGKALDLAEAAPVVGHGSVVTGGTDYAPAEGSDVVVVTAGLPRKPGMSRDDLLATNGKIHEEMSEILTALTVVEKSDAFRTVLRCNLLHLNGYVFKSLLP